MVSLNLRQITDTLNREFTCETRKLVFWYDDDASFAGDIHTLEQAMVNAKVHRLEPDNEFYTKYLLERQDPTTNYLIYAPFPKPPTEENHLADTLFYSRQFHADRVSLIMADLGIGEQYKPVFQKHIKFFGDGDSKAARARTQRFYELEIDEFTQDTIEIGLMSALCKARTASFEEVVRIVLDSGDLEGNRFLREFAKYDLTTAFWEQCEKHFGFQATGEPNLEKLVLALFVTHAARSIQDEPPVAWRNLVAYKPGSIIAFLDGFMNNRLYQERYDQLSEQVAATLNVAQALADYAPEALLHCDTFLAVDKLLIKWLRDCLLAEDTGAQLDGLTIPEICQTRLKMHFGQVCQEQYLVLENAYYLVQAARYSCPSHFQEILDQYTSIDYLIDTAYRNFYYWYDQLRDNTEFQALRELVENIYANRYLSVLVPRWNEALVGEDIAQAIPSQRDFYQRYVGVCRDRVIVIISDGLRYETAKSLQARLDSDPKCNVQLEAMLSVLPSNTRLGMAALLPHEALELTHDCSVQADGLLTHDLKQREAVLKRYVPNSRCVQFDDLVAMRRDEVRQFFAGMDVIYVYHNQIDARGDKQNTENEVFTACQEAIDEIYELIKRLTDDVSATHYIVTADHGFIYRRDKLQESDRIANVAGKDALLSRRFAISDVPLHADGVCSLPLGRILDNDDKRAVSFPLSVDVFKAAGGQNYVHGGASPQEMIIPVLNVRTERGRKETSTARIALVSVVQKITNLITTLEFMQTEPVSDLVRATRYRIYFVSEDNEKISNENIYVADKEDVEPHKRMFRFRFDFKNKRYEKTKSYYLVAYDENGLEVIRHAVLMDVAFAGDFGFSV